MLHIPHGRVGRPLRASGAVAVLAVCCGLASGCGSSSDDTSTAAGAAPASTSTSSSNGSAALQEARATVSKYLKTTRSIEVTEPLKKKPTGTFWYMACAAPSCLKQHTAGVKNAAKILGLGTKFTPLGLTPESSASAWNNAANADPAPGAIIAGGTVFETVKAQIGKLAAKKVPITTIGSALENKTPQGTTFPGVGFDVDPLKWPARQGELEADWIASDLNGSSASVLYVTIPDFQLFIPLKKAFEAKLGALCPKCDVTSVSANAAGIGTSLPKQVVSELQRKPSIKYVVFDFGDMVLGVPDALKAAGVSGAKIVSQSGSAQNIEYIKNGQQALDVATNNEYAAWKTMDAAARLATGEGTTADQELLPTQLVTKEGLENGTVTVGKDGQVNIVPGYEEQFKKLWEAAQ